MSRARVILGEFGEELACLELRRRGYAILARRYRRRGGEIDIVALDGTTVVFVEVKARAGAEYGRGVEAVTALKRRRLVATAADFLVRHRLAERPCRFDIVSIRLTDDGPPAIDLYPNAFDAGGFG